MNRYSLAGPEIAIIAGTRAALGAGLGLLLADRLSDEQRRAVGWTLFTIGAISTIPIAVQLLRSESSREEADVRRIFSRSAGAAGEIDLGGRGQAGLKR